MKIRRRDDVKGRSENTGILVSFLVIVVVFVVVAFAVQNIGFMFAVLTIVVVEFLGGKS